VKELMNKVQGEVREVDAAVLRVCLDRMLLARMPWNRTGAPPAAACQREGP
jgi:hypothetical protein